jgi:hypothetical protein
MISRLASQKGAEISKAHFARNSCANTLIVPSKGERKNEAVHSGAATGVPNPNRQRGAQSPMRRGGNLSECFVKTSPRTGTGGWRYVIWREEGHLGNLGIGFWNILLAPLMDAE